MMNETPGIIPEVVEALIYEILYEILKEPEFQERLKKIAAGRKRAPSPKEE